MDATLEAKLKTHKRLGTFFVDLPKLSAREGNACVALMRQMRGQDISNYLREQNRLSAAMVKLQRSRAEKDVKPDEPEQGTVAGGLSEAEEKNVYSIVASMRALLQHAVLKLFVDAPEGLQIYKITLSQTGDHEDNEVSLDLLEPEYAVMTNRLLVKSGLIPDTPFPETEPADAGGSGRDSEAVRPTPEPAGERVAG